VHDNWDDWREWQTEDDPYGSKVPGDFEDKISLFEKLVLVKVFRNELI